MAKSKKSSMTDKDYEEFMETYNSLSGKLPKIVVLNQARKRSIDGLVQDMGKVRALEVLAGATAEVALDPWWNGENDRNTKYGFDNLLRHVYQKYESWQARVSLSESEKTKFKVGEFVTVYGYFMGQVLENRTVGHNVQYKVDVYGKPIWEDESKLGKAALGLDGNGEALR